MKIFLLSPSSPTGGIASWTQNILEYIEEKNIQYLVHIDTSVKFKTQTNKNQLIRIISGCIDTLLLMTKFVLMYFKHKPTKIHITSSASLSLFKDLIFIIIQKTFRVKCIFHFRFGRIPELSRKKNWEWKLLSFIILHSYKTIVIDTTSYKTLKKEKKFSNNIVLIPNPCSQKIKSIALIEILPKRQGEYIFVGHVVKNKGVFELVQAFCEIPYNYHLTIIGPYEKKIKDELFYIAQKKKNGNWLSIIGNKDKEFIYDEMSTVNALILPSYTEGFPNVILEAMACGCPIIATNVGAISEMLDTNTENESSGICISPYSINEIKKAVIKLGNCEKGCLIYGLKGKQKVLKNYTLEKIYPMYESLWK